MFLDLWSLAILTGDLLELIVNHIESGTLSVSLPFVIFVIIFGTICGLAWKSTYIPDLPPAPRPPYVIQVTGHSTLLNNNGERNTFSDVRLLSSGADVETVFRRFPTGHGSGRTVNLSSIGVGGQLNQNSTRLNLQSRTNNVRVYPQPQQQQGQRQDGSALLRLLRPGSVIRPFISNRSTGTGNQTPNLIVYHRVNVYHHHHHHPIAGSNAASSENSQQSPSLPSASVSAPHSVDSFTQYETEDTSPHREVIQNEAEHLEVPTAHLDIETEEEEITLESEPLEEDQSTLLSSESHSNPNVPSRIDGLRHRSSPINSESNNIFRSDSSSTDLHASGSASGSMMGHEDIRKDQNDSSAGSQQTVPVEERVADIRFTIKFLNDTQLDVTTQPGENIADFKRRHFATEMSENKTVRLIFNGRVLDNDTSTIRESGIFDQCVVHCLIVARATIGPSPTGSGGNASLHQSTRRAPGLIRAPEPGMFFVAFVGVFLIFLWFICFHFGQHLFTQSAVVSLTVLTAIFLIGLVAFYLPVHPNQ